MVTEIRPDKDVIAEKLALFRQWAETGEPVFTLDDYAVLFQAGTFEYGKNCEDFCNAVYNHGPIPGPRTEK